jgi:hypothetical protein
MRVMPTWKKQATVHVEGVSYRAHGRADGGGKSSAAPPLHTPPGFRGRRESRADSGQPGPPGDGIPRPRRLRRDWRNAGFPHGCRGSSLPDREPPRRRGKAGLVGDFGGLGFLFRPPCGVAASLCVTPRYRGLVTTGRCFAVLVLPARLSPPHGRWRLGRSRRATRMQSHATPAQTPPGTAPHHLLRVSHREGSGWRTRMLRPSRTRSCRSCWPPVSLR